MYLPHFEPHRAARSFLLPGLDWAGFGWAGLGWAGRAALEPRPGVLRLVGQPPALAERSASAPPGAGVLRGQPAGLRPRDPRKGATAGQLETIGSKKSKHRRALHLPQRLGPVCHP